MSRLLRKQRTGNGTGWIARKIKMVSRKSNSRGFPLGVVVKNLPAKAGDVSSIPGSGRSPGGRQGQPDPVFLPENPRDRGAWQASLLGAIESRHD